jgi:hypothetical protein
MPEVLNPGYGAHPAHRSPPPANPPCTTRPHHRAYRTPARPRPGTLGQFAADQPDACHSHRPHARKWSLTWDGGRLKGCHDQEREVPGSSWKKVTPTLRLAARSRVRHLPASPLPRAEPWVPHAVPGERAAERLLQRRRQQPLRQLDPPSPAGHQTASETPAGSGSV